MPTSIHQQLSQLIQQDREEGHVTQNQVNLESRVKDAKGKGAATDLEGNSSEDENESSYVDSSLYGFTDSTPLDPIAYLSNIEDGVFGTRSNFVSASQVSSPCDVVYVGTGVPSRRDVDSGNPSTIGNMGQKSADFKELVFLFSAFLCWDEIMSTFCQRKLTSTWGFLGKFLNQLHYADNGSF
nr:hypothetical protein Iba_chr12dCG0700 [Ipomoea batatas]